MALSQEEIPPRRHRACPAGGRQGPPRGDCARADLLAGLPYATILPLTTELRPDNDLRNTVETTEGNGLRATSQVMDYRPQTARAKTMGAVIGRLDDATMRMVTEQLAIVLGIGGGDSEAELLADDLLDALRSPPRQR